MTQIKALRKIHNYTQQNVADMLGITRGAYANIENEKREPDLATLFFLADHYGVSIDYLVGHEKKPTVKDDGVTELEQLFLTLPQSRREEVIRFMEYQASQASADKVRQGPLEPWETTLAAARDGGVKAIPAESADAAAKEIITAENDAL